MCGISAILRLENCLKWDFDIHSMNELARHRGPDDQGIVYFQSNISSDLPCFTPSFEIKAPSDCLFAIAHRRLSIIDLSLAGHQPMCDITKRYWIVYNGEIFNYKELRLELEGLGHIFLSNSDTEVILASYAHWGKECLNRFNGMWVFIIFDVETGKIFISRDRFGVKPIYYWFSSEGFLAFASEIKQFTTLPGWVAQINGQRGYDFLVHGLLDHTNETMFKGVYQIRGGEAVEVLIKDIHDSIPIYRWYNLPISVFKGTLAEAGEKFWELLNESVKLRLRADVPVGSCLSGGLDSSSIVCLINEQLQIKNGGNKQKTFSACSLIKKFDEREFMEEVTNIRGIDAHYIYPENNSLFKELQSIIWYQDEPFGSTSIYAQWNVFRLASNNNIKVMLDGQGADEILAGYHSLFPAHIAGLLVKFKFLTLLKEINSLRKIHYYKFYKSIPNICYYLMSRHTRNGVKNFSIRYYFSPNWLNFEKLNAVPSFPPDPPKIYRDPLNDACYSLLFSISLPMLLHWEDRDSMAFSVESRVPFLDYRLVEFIMSLPSYYKIEGGITKRILRIGMKDTIPEKITRRMDKLGFATPEEVWLKDNPDQWREALSEAIKFSTGILNPEAKQELDLIIEGNKPFSFIVWRLICFGAWMKKFHVQLDPTKDSIK